MLKKLTGKADKKAILDMLTNLGEKAVLALVEQFPCMAIQKGLP